MSRIWKLPIKIPAWVNVSVTQNVVKVSSSKWELSFEIKNFISLNISNDLINVNIKDENDVIQKSIWWLTRTLISNMIIWVTDWFQKALEIQWVWYKFEVTSKDKIILAIWLSNKVNITAPEWITIENDPSNKNIIFIKWMNKEKVGLFAAKIRSLKKPEPYKWKWIRYVWEYVRRKAWKTWAKKG